MNEEEAERVREAFRLYLESGSVAEVYLAFASGVD